MAELLIAVSILSVLVLLTFHGRHDINESCYTFPDRYLAVQSEALLKASPEQISAQDDSSSVIYFSRYGNVLNPQTLHFTDGRKHRSVIVELGTGRLVLR